MGHSIACVHTLNNEVNVNSKIIKDKLLKLSRLTGISFIQKNGQRYFGPPPNWLGPPPVKGSEIYIANIPKDCFEDELIPVVAFIGNVYELRLMLNISGFTRGFAYVTYCNPQDAWQAILYLDNYEIRPGYKLAVTKSTENCNLFIKHIPMNKTKEEVLQELQKIAPTLVNVQIHKSTKRKNVNRGYAFVEFNSHHEAAVAKNKITPENRKLWDKEITIDWAVKEPTIEPFYTKTETKLFIRNVKSHFTIESLTKLICEVIPSHTVTQLHISGYYGFVHFDNREHAQLAKDKLSLIRLNGEMIHVSWVKPKFLKKLIKSDKNRFKVHNTANKEKIKKIINHPSTPVPHVYLLQLKNNEQQHNEQPKEESQPEPPQPHPQRQLQPQIAAPYILFPPVRLLAPVIEYAENLNNVRFHYLPPLFNFNPFLYFRR